MFKESHMQASIADNVLVILFSGFLCLWYSSALPEAGLEDRGSPGAGDKRVIENLARKHEALG
jgi:hypothetical protein